MGHGHRRRLHDEFDHPRADAEDVALEELAGVDAAIAELLVPRPIDAREIRTEYPPGYHRYPRFESDEEAEKARLAGSWDPDDYRVRRLLEPGDPDGPRVRTAGRSSGGRRRRERKPVAIDAPVGGTGGGERNLSDSRFRVYGLTRGEAEFYHRRTGEARAQLIVIAKRILEEQRRPELTVPTTRENARKLNFDVFGLSREQIVALRACPGCAKEGLIAFAHEQAHDWIVARDRA